MTEKPKNNFVNWKSFLGIIGIGLLILIPIIGFINSLDINIKSNF